MTYKVALPRLLLLFDSVQLSVLNLRAREKSKTISVRTLEEHHHRITLSLMGPASKAPDLADFGTNTIMAEIICLTLRERGVK